MPKNKGKGGKNRRRGKNENDKEKREITLKEPGQEYAQATKILGNGYIEAFCFDGNRRICHIRGKLRKKVWVNFGDIILVGVRDFQKDRADVILKYTSDEAKTLKSTKEIPADIKISEVQGFGSGNYDDNEINFDLREEAVEVPKQEETYDMPSSDSSSYETEESDS